MDKNKKKILIVDDEPDLVAELTLRLEAEGWDVIPAYDGEEGLKKVENEHPDIVLLDIVMPKLSGYQVCRKLKKDPKTKDIPIIILTAKSDESAKFTAKDIGSDDFIIKPYDGDMLVKKIRGYLNKK